MVIGTPTVLNLIPGGVMKVIHVNQVNENIEIQFRIMNGAQPFNVPEGVSCTIRGTKGDNFGYAADVAVTAGSNIVTVTLTEQLTAVAGAGNIFELVFVGASDDMKVSTENFLLDVERAALGEDTVISDSDLAYADQVLDQLQSVGAVNAQVQQNKANIAAEITRATAAEQTLQQNINAEAAARQAADNTLQSNINAEASSRATTDASLQSQINQLVAPSGEAPSAAEVQNARIGTDGTVYPTLGDAIRTQNSLLKSQLVDLANATSGYTRVITVKGHIDQSSISTTVEFAASAGDTVTFEMDIDDASTLSTLATLFYNGNTLLQQVNVQRATKTKWVATGDVTKIMVYCGLTSAQATPLTVTAKYYDYYGKGVLEVQSEEHANAIEDLQEQYLQNLINPNDPDYTPNANIVAATGNVALNNQHFDATGYLKLKPNTKYYVGGLYLVNLYAFYDENKAKISTYPTITAVPSKIYAQNNYHGYFTTGDDVLYFRGSINRDYSSIAYVSEYYDQYMQYGSDTALGSEKVSNLVPDYQFKSVLVIGDSISTGASSARLNTNMPSYANYDKWVDDLISIGFFPAETTYNCSQHATGFIRRAGSASWSPHSDFYERLLYCENEGYWNKADIDLVVVYGGINDYSRAVPIGNDETDYTVYFAPAVRNLFDYLLNNYTQARICILTPTLVDRGTQDTVSGIHVYSDVIKNEARARTFPVLDLTEESGFYPFNTAFKNMWTYLVNGTTPDGAHPNYDYQRKYLAPMIMSFLMGKVAH